MEERNHLCDKKHRRLGADVVLGNKWIQYRKTYIKVRQEFGSRAVETELGSGISLRPIFIPGGTRPSTAPRVRGGCYRITKRRFSIACSCRPGDRRLASTPISGPIFRVPRRGQTVPVVSHRWLWIVPQRRRDSLVFVSRSAGRWRAGRAARPSCTGWCIHISIWRRSTIVCHFPGHIARSGSVTGWGFTVARVQRRRIVGRAAVVARGRRSRSHAIIFVFA